MVAMTYQITKEEYLRRYARQVFAKHPSPERIQHLFDFGMSLIADEREVRRIMKEAREEF